MSQAQGADVNGDKMDRNTLGGRVKRYGGVTKAMGGLAVHLAGSRVLGRDIDKDAHSETLKLALGNLKGPLMKAAQILATIPDVLPKEYAEELRELQSNAPPMSWPFVRRRMKAELGPDWQSVFDNFEREATAAASLGQVHKAVLPTGEQVACKLQYPDMASAVEADVKQLKLAVKAYRAFDKSIDPTEALEEVTDRLREELDYDLEAKHLALFAYIFSQDFEEFDTSRVRIPKVFESHTSSRLLTMSWEAGRPIVDLLAEGMDQDRRNEIARDMFYAWNLPIYKFGVVHGDPHLGNYSFRDDGGLNLLDFGCVRKFTPSFIAGVLEMYQALLSEDEERLVAAYEAWGFVDLSRDAVDVLNRWARYLFAPLMEDRPIRLSESNSIEKGAQVVHSVHAELKKIGGVKIPREFVFMDRAAIGMGSLYIRLDAELNWHRMMNELTDDFNVETLKQRQAEALAHAGLL